MNTREESADIRSRVREQFGRSSEAYASSAVHARGESLRILLERVRPENDWRVLDVGTGAGHTALTFAPFVERVVATDITPAMLARTRELADKAGIQNVETKEADAESLPFPSESFDLLTCRLAFHHFPEPKATLHEWIRVLKPGGVLGLSDNFTVEDPEAAAHYNRYEKLRDPSHFCVPALEELKGWVTKAGFEIRSVDTISKDFEFHKWADRQRVSAQDKKRLLGMMKSIPQPLESFFQPRWTGSTMYFKLWEAVIVATRV